MPRLSHAERDVVMKKHLVEDMRTRLRFFQETDKSLKGQLEEQEKKVCPVPFITHTHTCLQNS